MTKVARKDYGENAILPDSNPTLKRVKFINAPKSFQSLGLNHNKPKWLNVTEENIDALPTNTRYIEGNVEGHVESITTTGVDPDITLASLVLAYSKDGEKITKTLTRDELLASGTIYFATTD